MTRVHVYESFQNHHDGYSLEHANQLEGEQTEHYLRYLAACRDWPDMRHDMVGPMPMRREWVKREFERRMS